MVYNFQGSNELRVGHGRFDLLSERRQNDAKSVDVVEYIYIASGILYRLTTQLVKRETW